MDEYDRRVTFACDDVVDEWHLWLVGFVVYGGQHSSA
jgi:hypothetical protein